MKLPRLIPVEELFADPEFSGASISPDGTRLAYLAPSGGRLNVWVRGIDEEHADAVCVTHDTRRGIRTYHWTDDPRWLLYLQDTDGNEDWHLFRVDLHDPTAPAVDLTPLDPGSRVVGVETVKDRPGVVRVGMNKNPLFFEGFDIVLATGETTLLKANTSMLGSWGHGPNGELFFIDLTQDGYWEYSLVDEAGEHHVFLRAGGPEHPVGLSPTTMAPDGKAFYVSLYGDGDDLRLVRVDVQTGEQSVFAELPGHAVDMMGVMLPTMPQSLFISRRTGDVMGVRFVGDRPIVLPTDPTFAEVLEKVSQLSDGVLASASSDKTERYWVVSFVHDTDPGKTFLFDHQTGESRLLFKAYPQLDPAQLAPMEAVHTTARDGLPLTSFLTLPLGVEHKDLPLVLYVHGGPWANDAWSYDQVAQFFANRGLAVLQVNFRGSAGYGKRHITAAIKELSGKMHDDLIDAADHLVAQGLVDPTRIGIFGASYGGYATLVGVTFTPDYFAAAVDYVGMSSLKDLMGSMPDFVKPTMINNWYTYVGDPSDPEDAADMMARSPITHVDKITTPLLVAQGANDARVVKAESDRIVEALRARDVDVEYIVAEDEGHGFQNPENSVRLYKAIERHFGRYLGSRTAS